MAGGASSGGGQFGDTTLTKLFVGGLAWETQRDTLSNYFQQFGEILEAVVITDKASGRSKGYGFVTFREPEAALRACADAYPVIDGRRANCNLAYLGVQKSKPASPMNGGGKTFRVIKASEGGGTGLMESFPAPSTFPHYAVHQGVPYNVYGYSPYSTDYAYPHLGYYGMYGGGGSQYPIYGGGMGGVVVGHNSAPLYPMYHLEQGSQGGAAAYAQGSPSIGVAVQRHNIVAYGGVAGFAPQVYGGPAPVPFHTPATSTPVPSQGMTMALMTPPTQLVSLVPRSYRIVPTHYIPSAASPEKP